MIKMNAIVVIQDILKLVRMIIQYVSNAVKIVINAKVHQSVQIVNMAMYLIMIYLNVFYVNKTLIFVKDAKNKAIVYNVKMDTI